MNLGPRKSLLSQDTLGQDLRTGQLCVRTLRGRAPLFCHRLSPVRDCRPGSPRERMRLWMLPLSRASQKMLRPQPYIGTSQELSSRAANPGAAHCAWSRPVPMLPLAPPKIGSLPQLPWKKTNQFRSTTSLLPSNPTRN